MPPPSTKYDLIVFRRFVCKSLTLLNLNFYIQNERTYLISFPVQYCFPFRFVCMSFFTHLISSNLSCNLCLRYYDQLVHFDKEIHANVYRHSLWEYSKRFHCSFEWHLTSHITLSIETCIRWTPSIPRGCPVNTGFTVC